MEEDPREVFKKSVQLSKGINMKDLMAGQAEFQLDMDFKQTRDKLDLTEFGDMAQLVHDSENDDDSDDEDMVQKIEQRTEEKLLASPEYLSFEELASKMIDVPCNPSGAVKIMILEEGNGPLIALEAEVTLHYAAYWERDVVPFDTSLTHHTGQPQRIHLGRGACLPGLEIALTNVRGPTARVLALLAPRVAWGERGAPPRIRPEPALFVIAVYSTETDEALSFNKLPMEEQTKFTTTIQTVKSIRKTAKDTFTRKKYNKAINSYQQAMHVISLSRPETEQDKKEIKRITIQLFVNLAVCYYKLKKPQHVLDMCKNIDKIIHIETHCKALFYYGRALEMMGKMDEALDYYKKALKLEPNNKEIGRLLSEIDKKIVKSTNDEKSMWRKAFNTENDAKVKYNVDEEFENGVREVCEDLASRTTYTKFDLPTGLTNDEVTCIKDLAGQFQGLILEENGEGKKRRVAILKL